MVRNSINQNLKCLSLNSVGALVDIVEALSIIPVNLSFSFFFLN